MRVFVTFVAVALLGQSVAQATNIALNAPVINQSSIGNLIGPNFVVANVDDGQGVTTNQLGVTASENYNDGSYWLNYSTGTEFFILDLGAPSPIGQIRIANTDNGVYGDRQGDTFEVLASNTLGSGTAGVLGVDDNGTYLVSPVTLVNSVLTPPTSGSITFDVFNPSGANLGSYQYIEYVQLSAVVGTGHYSGGLNEFQVIGVVVPEPSSVVLGCVAACGLFFVVRRRR